MNTTETTVPGSDVFTVGANLSPTHLSYVAALRGIVAHAPRTAFAYAQVGCSDTEAFLCLAASNPEGRFFAVVDSDRCAKAQKQATARRVSNVSFLASTEVLRELDYLVCDSSDTSMSRDHLAALAGKSLREGGLLAYRYRAYPNADETLRFVTNEFAPEMSVDQSKTFLYELKALGSKYFETHPIAAAALDKAIAQSVPDLFFSTCEHGGKATSGAFETLIAMGPHGLAYVGDANIRENYMDIVAPTSSHEILAECQTNLLYEPIKDFVIQRLERCDIWCRLPVQKSENLSDLFNNFTFGVTISKTRVPEQVATYGKTIVLKTPLYQNLIDMMSVTPICVGDFLHDARGEGVMPEDAVAAVQMLVALGIAVPMRSSYQGQQNAVLSYPKWETGFNKYLNESLVTTPEILLASPVVGSAIRLPARDALVIQAINRAGMKDSVSALMPELKRIANDPALAARVMDTAEPTPEAARNMIVDVLNHSMIQLYSYGVLAA
jgi:hypothetical protein